MIVKITFSEAQDLYYNDDVFKFLPRTMKEKISSIMLARDEVSSFVRNFPDYIQDFDINDKVKMAGMRVVIRDILQLDINGLFDGDTYVYSRIACIGNMFEFIDDYGKDDHNFLKEMLNIHKDISLYVLPIASEPFLQSSYKIGANTKFAAALNNKRTIGQDLTSFVFED